MASGEAARARTCSGDAATLTEGTNRVTVRASTLFDAGRTVLTAQGSQGFGRGAGDLVTRTQNANPGWDGVAEGRSVAPVTVNGWQRGWRLAGTGPTDVAETFGPNESYRVALVAGAATALLLLGIALVRGRRPPARSPIRSRPVGSGWSASSGPSRCSGWWPVRPGWPARSSARRSAQVWRAAGMRRPAGSRDHWWRPWVATPGGPSPAVTYRSSRGSSLSCARPRRSAWSSVSWCGVPARAT